MENLVNAYKDARIETLKRLIDLRAKDASHSERTALEKLDAALEEALGCYKTGEWKAKANGSKLTEGVDSG